MPKVCMVCGQQRTSAAVLGVCGPCIRDPGPALRTMIRRVHRRTRAPFGLPGEPPRAPDGVECPLCIHRCRIAEGGTGFCGLRTVRNGRLVHRAGTPKKGLFHWYFDPLPTNCVAAWVCAGRDRYGYRNLAVFYGACTMNCLFCQNWHYREMDPEGPGGSGEELARVADERTFCVCFFGGDPTPQMPHALAAAHRLAQKGVRICWETSGTMNPTLLEQAVRLSLTSGGCIKFDLKAHNDDLHRALTGVSNRRTLDNFSRAASYSGQRREPPLVVASTLLVPGYIDADEVYQIARFIARHDPEIPYSLLAFHPHFYMRDLPLTSARLAREAEAAARAAGLRNVHIGNRHLLV